MRSKRSRNQLSGKGPDDELDFVDGELLQLAAQLGAQANQLATVYPPKAAGPQSKSSYARTWHAPVGRSRNMSARCEEVTNEGSKEAAWEGCPSGSEPSPCHPVWQLLTKRRLGWGATCAALVLAVGLGSQLPRSSTSTLDDTAPTGWQPTRPAPQAPVLADNAKQDTNPLPDSAPIISPVMFVSELSDPEFEAWLDLRRDRGDERIAF